MKVRQGEDHHNAKLTDKIVQEMRRLYWCENVRVFKIAYQFKCTYMTAYDVVKYRTWLHVKESFKSQEIVRED